jgi:repressor LexA
MEIEVPTAVRPTKKQKELLAYIEQFIVEHGYSPSYREIMTGLQYTSVATVALHVNNLIKRGHLRKREHNARSLEVVEQSRELATPGSVRSNEVKPAEEKWLVEKVEYAFANAESVQQPAEKDLQDIVILLQALRVLGLDGVAQSFGVRLRKLKEIGNSSA